MKPSESVVQFLQSQGRPDAGSYPLREAAKSGRFHVYDVENFCARALNHSRRDFYKISLLLEREDN